MKSTRIVDLDPYEHGQKLSTVMKGRKLSNFTNVQVRIFIQVKKQLFWFKILMRLLKKIVSTSFVIKMTESNNGYYTQTLRR